jgi:hypothetical protein
LATTPAGAIVMLTESSVPRLRTEVPLRFGKIRNPAARNNDESPVVARAKN